ncbi:hypothetical protein [Treponema putidum]|uniref:hypothetical protein n=1 Tax=Treponema putidum TaxID=221027 RepID=UPI0021067C65|nr:hypothetical protein [Treponema putidum]
MKKTAVLIYESYCNFEISVALECLALKNQHTPTQSIRVCCSYKVVAVGFNTLYYDAELTLRSNRVLNPPHE